jgi:rhodanese-related sulfurtransferase
MPSFDLPSISEPATDALNFMEHLSPAELAVWLADAQSEKRDAPILLDVREPWEFETCHIPGSRVMPMASVPARQEELDPEQSVVCICHHGARSMQVAAFLERAGFSKVYNLSGGVNGWALQVDPSMPTY